ncbi:hypothetical protein SAMN05216312_1272 [Cohnella sp. OV330]|nr:hypothetical protein SAMN05216312_1272 [Cohnella sp. OV330]
MIVSVIVAIFAVFLGARMQLEYLREESERNDIQQRLKLLKLIQHELTLNRVFREHGGMYRATEFYAGKQLLQYPGFSPDKYQSELELTLEVIRNFEMLHIAIDAMWNYSNHRMALISNPTILQNFFTGIEALIGKRTMVELTAEQINELTRKVISENATLLDKASSSLLTLISEKSIPAMDEEERTGILPTSEEKKKFTTFMVGASYQ